MNTANTHSEKLKYWIFAGLTGLLVFFSLLSQFYFLANAPVTYSKEEAVEKTQSLYNDLGIKADTLGTIPFRQQRIGLYQSVIDSLNDSAPSPARLNQENFHLHGWDVVSASILGLDDAFGLTAGSIYDAGGVYRTTMDNSGRIKSFELQKDRGGQSRIEGDQTLETAQKIVGEIFGYDLSEYQFLEATGEDDLAGDQLTVDTESRSRVIGTPEPPVGFKWKKANGSSNEFIEIELSPIYDLQGTASENPAQPRVSVDRFEAYHEMEKLPSTSTDDYFLVLFMSTIALIVLLTFIEGLGQIFKGKADWKRILFVALGATIGIFAWRLIFTLGFSDLLTVQANIVIQFNQLVFGLVMGLFVSVAYIGWEAYARGEKLFQIDLIDAFWQGKLFLRETGSSILKGFSLGGVMLGITAFFMTFAGIYMYHSDSQYGFAEVVNRPQFLSINLSVFVLAAVVSIALIGIVYNFYNKRIGNRSVVMTASILTGGLLLAGLGRSFGTNGSELQDVLLFILVAAPLFGTYKASGLVTVFAAIWFYSSVINILPYAGSPSPEVAATAWVQLLIASGVILFGIAAYRKAPSISTVSGYVPDYERKIMRNMRFENEMQIARESQQKLMPFEPLMTDDYELHGYFLPSFEVGGDYFDYVENTDSEGLTHLTLTVVDVSGKSMRAAMHAVFTSGLLRSRMYTDQPDKILREICPVIFEKTDSQTFITCLVSRFEPSTATMKIAIAGHCLPILKRDGKAHFLRAPEPHYPLGVRQKVEYRQLEINVKPGDLIVYYSDGFPEAVNEKGERIGFDQALKYVESLECDHLSAREICNRIKEYIEEFSIERLADDTTILCLKIK